MEKLVLGIDLCDAYTDIAVSGREKTRVIPTVVCRMKREEVWKIGEEAYKCGLLGEGILADQLLTLAMKEKTATICGNKYQGKELLTIFLKQMMDGILSAIPDSVIETVIFSLQDMRREVLDCLASCMEEAGIRKTSVRFASRTECFAYYVLSQRRDIWARQVGLFDLTDKHLGYYEMKVSQGPGKMTVEAEYEEMEEGFQINILDTDEGSRMADRILTSCAERLLSKKAFSSVFLTGKGFEKTEWASGFMKTICAKRRVYSETSLFARGAVLRSEEMFSPRSHYPVVCLCEGKIRSTVTIKVAGRSREAMVVLAAAGDSFYEAGSTLDVLTEGEKELEFVLISQETGAKRAVRVPLTGIPERPKKTTRLRISVGFQDDKTMLIKIADLGFGEIWPSSGKVISHEVRV